MARPVPMKLPNRLRSLRVKCGLTFEQLSAATGIGISKLYGLEKGAREATLVTAFKLVHLYRVPLQNIWESLYEEVGQHVTPLHPPPKCANVQPHHPNNAKIARLLQSSRSKPCCAPQRHTADFRTT